MNKVLYKKEERTVRITLNSPQTSNAVDPELGSDLADALERAENDPDVKAVVLTGQGKNFSAGANIKAMKADLEADPKTTAGRVLKTYVTSFAKAAANIFLSDKIVVAAVNGAAAGGGLALALACDVVIAAHDATLSPAYVKLGLVPVGGLSALLPRIVGQKKAADLLYRAAPISADEALQLGLVSRIAPADQLIETAAQTARRIAAHPGMGAAHAKKLLLAGLGLDIQKQLALENQSLADCGDHPEHEATMNALLAKLSKPAD